MGFVKGVLHGLGHLNISQLIMLQKVRFYKHMFLSANSYTSVMCNMFSFTLLHNYTSDNVLHTVFIPQCLAFDVVYCLFNNCFFSLCCSALCE